MLLCIASALAGWAEGEFHVFTDMQGRAVMLKVVDCDLTHNKVMVEREDGRRRSVKVSGFSESDQAYIKAWYMANELISEQNLRISIDEEIIRRDEDIQGRIYQGRTLVGGIVGESKHEQIAYVIAIENRSELPVEQVQIEYKIYYEQAERHMKVREQKIFFQSGRLPTLEARGKVTFKTQSVEVIRERLFGKRYADHRPAEGYVHGIRGRLIVKLSDKQEVVREFQYPSSLSDKRYPW